MARLEIAWCKLVHWRAALGLLGGVSQGCANEYPIQPTFCDDFCRATLRPQCDNQPEDCVRECELRDVSARCEPDQQALLTCYTEAPDDAFACWGWGSSVRVRDGVCEAERDAFLVCELPDIESCLDFCRPYQTALDQRLQSQVGAADASVSDQCVLLRQSCEGICWNLLTIGAPEVNDSFGRGDWSPNVDGLPRANDAGVLDLQSAAQALLPGCGL